MAKSTDYARYLWWVLHGKCQICGGFSHGRQLCPACEEGINAEIFNTNFPGSW